jgi:hypothetical protein
MEGLQEALNFHVRLAVGGARVFAGIEDALCGLHFRYRFKTASYTRQVHPTDNAPRVLTGRQERSPLTRTQFVGLSAGGQENDK